VDDSAAPRLSDITVREGVMEIELSEEAGLSSAAAAIQIDGAPTSWTLDESRYVLVSEAMLSTGTHQIDVGTGALNLVGRSEAGVDDREWKEREPLPARSAHMPHPHTSLPRIPQAI
jgi:hypothetical protein